MNGPARAKKELTKNKEKVQCLTCEKATKNPKSLKYLCVKMHGSNDQMGLSFVAIAVLFATVIFRMVFNIYRRCFYLFDWAIFGV